MSIEYLAPMWAGCTSYHPAQSLGCAHSDALNRVEIAGMMAGLLGHQRDYIYAWFGDEPAECRLIAHVRTWLCDLAHLENWKVERGRPVVSNIGAVAVFESVRPNVCRYCGGSGFTGNILSVRRCTRCSGSGHIRLSNRKIADAIGIDEANYRRTWCGRYERSAKYMQAIESEVNFVLRKACRRDGLLFA